MNQQINNAPGGYAKSVATVGGGSNSQDLVPAQPAPDTLLEQIKELREQLDSESWNTHNTAYGGLRDLSPQMADRIIADAKKRKQDEREVKMLAENERLQHRIEQLERKFAPDYDCKALLVAELNNIRAENERLQGWLLQLVLHIEDDGGVVPE